LPRGNRMAAMMAANFNLAHVDFVGPIYVFQKKERWVCLDYPSLPVVSLFWCVRIRYHNRKRLRKRLAYPAVSENV
jgi:hypothetical protein